jgi:AhpD family alkylhydroperoxidase
MQTQEQETGKSILDEKTRELIAIGAAVAGHCQPCLTYHVARAKELGVGADEIREAIGVGHMVEKGAMAAMRDFSKEVMGEPVSRSAVCCTGKSEAGTKCGG